MKNKCKFCKYNWNGRIEKPKSCPRCKRYDWDDEEKDKEVKND